MRRILLLILAVCLSPALAVAQPAAVALVSPQAARQVGLERMWYTQLSLDRGRGRIAGLFLHVSATHSHTVFQIAHDGRRYVFSERDRNAFGKEIGVEGAKEEAGKKAEEIKKQLQDAGKADAEAPAVETIVVPKITLYGSSERGTVHALDGETGRTLWTTSVGNSLYPTTSPAANDKFAAVCNGSTLYVLQASDGAVLWTRSLTGSPGAGPAMTDNYVFVPMISGQVETLDLEDPWKPAARFQSFGPTMVQPGVSSNSVAWPTDSGNLYVGLAHAPGLRFRMQAGDTISSAPAFLAPDRVYATSMDGYIYCLGEQKGNILWRFTTGEPLRHSPVALGKMVYAISTRGNMYAVDADNAAERWLVGGIRSYLAGNDKRLYCLDDRGNLAILDAKTGSRLGTLSGVGGDLVPILNPQTDRIFLVTSRGFVQCLRQTNHPWPMVHYQIEPQKKETRKTPTLGGKTEEKKEASPSDDPFGAPGAAPPTSMPGGDPFGNPGAAQPAQPPGADPFAMP
jgi:outer membrane protein assembly factor BamB